MGSSAQIGKFFIRRSQEQKRCTFLGPKHKSTIWDRTPPHLHIKPSLYVCRRAQESHIFKENWIILIHSRIIVILLIWVFLALGVGQVDGGYPGWPTIVYISSGMFRGKESSNRIKMSWLAQELLNFGFWAPYGSGEGPGGWWAVSGHEGCPHTCAHACMDMYTCIEIANGHPHGGIHVYHVYNMWEEIFPRAAFDGSDFSLWFCRGQSTGTYGLHHSGMSQDWHFVHLVHWSSQDR